MESELSKAQKSSVTTFDEGWPILQEAIEKIINTLEGGHQFQLPDDYMTLYITVYNICSPNPIGPEVQRLYDHYKKTFEDYISSKVVPSLRGSKEEILLQELVKRWSNHKIMTRWLSRFFHYIDRYFVVRKRLPTLQRTSHLAFYQLVYREINDQVKDVVMSLHLYRRYYSLLIRGPRARAHIFEINKEREGEAIDQALLKNVVDIYVEMAEGSMNYYEKDFEEALLKDTSEFYSKKASDWIATNSNEQYMLKVEECLNQEKVRVSTYLRDTSKHKLLEVVQNELLPAHESKLA